MTASLVPAPPTIFSAHRRIALRRRMRHLQMRSDAARFVIEDMIDDVLDRLSFLRHAPSRALVVGDFTGALAAALTAQGIAVTRADPAPIAGEQAIDEELPLPFGDRCDLIVSLGTLDTVNDLPGALIHLRRSLAPQGLAIVAMAGAGSLPTMRAVMLAADGDHPAPRIHPQVDVRAGGQLLQRAGFADPVVDSRSVRASYRTFERLVGDLRAQAMTACLVRGGAALGRAALDRARAAFAARAQDGRVTETFEILTLSGWAKDLKPPKF